MKTCKNYTKYEFCGKYDNLYCPTRLIVSSDMSNKYTNFIYYDYKEGELYDNT